MTVVSLAGLALVVGTTVTQLFITKVHGRQAALSSTSYLVTLVIAAVIVLVAPIVLAVDSELARQDRRYHSDLERDRAG